jgi:KEOPS complex subunit Cgi121
VSHAILGARGVIRDPEESLKQVRLWAASHGTEILVADARAIFGRDHLESAVRHAERARSEGRMGARSLAVETLLYVSGQRQVIDAFRVAGLRKGTERVALVLWPAENPEELLSGLGWTRDDAVLEAPGKSLDVLGVTKTEKDTIGETAATDLALEKVALLDVTR